MSNSKYLDSAGTQKIVNNIKENKATADRHISTNMYDTEVHGLWYDDANKTLNIRNSETGEVVALAYNGGGGVTHSGKIMTAKIDLLNSNPETAVTYADDAVEMTPGSDEWDAFFGHYPCLLKNGVEAGKLNRNNFDQFENGSPADISSGDAGDAMIAFPRRGLKIYKNGYELIVSMTDNPDNPDFKYYAHERGETRKERFYLGVYRGYMGPQSKLRSLKGKTPYTTNNLTAFRNSAHNRGVGYEVSGFYQIIFRQAMYLLKYKNLDSQTAVGTGGGDNINTGGTESKGMDWGEPAGTQHMKLFGIEDVWSGKTEWVEGIVVNDSGDILTATDNFNFTGDGYKKCGKAPYVSEFMSDAIGSTEVGFIAQTGKGSETTYFCDYGGCPQGSGHYPYYGGGGSAQAGVFYFRGGSLTWMEEHITVRLMYL